MVLQLVQRERSDNAGMEQSWSQLMHCALISYHMCSCLFQSNGMLSKREVNSGVRSYIAESTTRGSDFKTLGL